MISEENIENKSVLQEIFKINQRLEILLGTDDDFLELYKSRIEETHPEYLVIAMPITKGVPVSLKKGDPFSGRAPSGTFSYKFTSQYIDRRMSPLPVWIVSWPEQVTKVQQRAFVRMEVMLPTFLTVKAGNRGEEPEKISAMTKDISGGGLQLILEKSLALGTKVQLMVNLPESGMTTAIGEVTRVQQPQADRPLFWVSVKYLDIQEKDR
ncbi:MAG TPA: flagellar brake protein, partial [Patescibacteria group bacterium]|nr:flagellar brake protein [Patescibacteria group bacterium]